MQNLYQNGSIVMKHFGISLYERVLHLDPDDADAWIGKADALGSLDAIGLSTRLYASSHGLWASPTP